VLVCPGRWKKDEKGVGRESMMPEIRGESEKIGNEIRGRE